MPEIIVRTTHTRMAPKLFQRFYDTLGPHLPRQAKKNASAAANEQAGNASASAAAHGQSAASPLAVSVDHAEPNIAVADAPAVGVHSGDDGVDAGVDLSERAYAAGPSEAGAKVLCSWLNANVAPTFMKVRTRDWSRVG